jgi:putative protease
MTPELLAPAGSFACAEAALAHGADAVYAGIGRFNLRAHSPNFTALEFGELLKFASGAGKRVYGVLNIMPSDDMLAPIEETLRRLAERRALPDAFIVSDPGVLSIVSELCAGVPIHLSTQSGCFNSASMRFWRKQGVSRAILPRELDIGQIRSLSSQNIMETEIFIHGAMCVSISGRCLLGAYYNGRHPNLGDCPQPCRFKYRIAPAEQVGVDSAHLGFDVEEVIGERVVDEKIVNDGSVNNGSVNGGIINNEAINNGMINGRRIDNGANGEWKPDKGAYLLNSKDLCTVGILPRLIESGAASFKIEGRNKTAYYVASVVKVYRDAINTYIGSPKEYAVKDWWNEELDAIEHRPYTTGFYEADPIKQEVFSSKAQAGYRLVGIVKAATDGRPIVDVKNSFSVSPINVLPVKTGHIPFDLHFTAIKEFDGTVGADCPRARPNRLVVLEGCGEKLRVGDMLRIRY